MIDVCHEETSFSYGERSSWIADPLIVLSSPFAE